MHHRRDADVKCITGIAQGSANSVIIKPIATISGVDGTKENRNLLDNVLYRLFFKG